MGLQMSYPVWAGSTLEELLCHIQLALDTIECKGYFKAFPVASDPCKKAQLKVQETEALIKEITLPDMTGAKKTWSLGQSTWKNMMPSMTA